jgi:hypothetical protein
MPWPRTTWPSVCNALARIIHKSVPRSVQTLPMPELRSLLAIPTRNGVQEFHGDVCAVPTNKLRDVVPAYVINPGSVCEGPQGRERGLNPAPITGCDLTRPHRAAWSAGKVLGPPYSARPYPHSAHPCLLAGRWISLAS